jgi:RNA polymerase sigma-70 factor, ECF subfamily
MRRISPAVERAPDGWDWVRLRDRCLREAHRLLPRSEAEEAVQEAMARAWARRDACRTPDRPLPWMLEITRNEAKRVLARRAAAGATALLHEREVEDERLAGATVRLTVQQAVGRLALSDRRVLGLRYSEDLTQAEVARRLGLPVGTVKVRLHRARRRLRPLLEELSPRGATRSA